MSTESGTGTCREVLAKESCAAFYRSQCCHFNNSQQAFRGNLSGLQSWPGQHWSVSDLVRRRTSFLWWDCDSYSYPIEGLRPFRIIMRWVPKICHKQSRAMEKHGERGIGIHGGELCWNWIRSRRHLQPHSGRQNIRPLERCVMYCAIVSCFTWHL